MNLTPVFNGMWKWAKRNSTKLLAAGAITAEALGFWFMHREAPVVRDRLDELGPDAKWYEKVKAAGPIYLPAIGMLALSVGCIVGGCAMGERKAAIMASLYSASEASLRRLEKKVVQEIGAEKAQKLHDQAAEELAKQNPPTPSNVKETGKGHILFFETRTGQWIRSDYNAVRKDAADFNQYITDTFKILDFNEWLDCLGGDRAGFGDMFGFGPDWRLRLKLSGEMRTDTGELYYIIDYFDGKGYGPVMYNGKPGVEFNRAEDCFPPSY